MAGRPATLSIRVTSDSRQARQDMRRVPAEASATFDKLKSVVTAGAVVLGAAITKGIGQALDQQEITGRLAAQLGATGPEAEKYGKAAGAVYMKGFANDFQQGADAVRAVMQNGIAPPGATKDQLADISNRVVVLANTFDQDLRMSGQAVGNMMKNRLAPDAKSAMDMLTHALQGPLGKSDDLMETMQEYSVQFAKVGLDGPKAMGLMQQALKGGARDADTAADAIKEFAIRSVDGTKSTADAYKILGLSQSDMTAALLKGGADGEAAMQKIFKSMSGLKDPVDKNTASLALFGTKQEDLGNAWKSMDPSTAVKAFGDYKDANDKAQKSQDNAALAVKKFQRAMEQGFVNFIGEKVIPALVKFGGWINDNVVPVMKTIGTTITDDVVPALTDFGKWVAKTANDWSPLLAGIGTFAALLGGPALAALVASKAALLVFSGAMRVYRGIMVITSIATKAWAVAQRLLNLVMNQNPIMRVVTIILTLVAVIVTAYKKNETFRNICNKVWDIIKKVGASIGGFFVAAFNKAKSAVGWVIDKVKSVVSWFGKIKFPNPLNAIKAGFDKVKQAASWVIDKVKSVINWLKKIPGGGLLSKAINAMKGARGMPQLNSDTGGLRTAAAGPANRPMVNLTPRFAVNVTIGGEQLDARIRSVIQDAMNADGARYAAGGWA